ncbi:MAG TPA: hypothetical protein VHG71_10330 [Verrucomicrobiae bacterium]|nr:hypothetical protein [Verrucomicrobiae bacterium]
MGIAQRIISIEFEPETTQPKQEKPLVLCVKTVGDWIRVNRIAKNFASYHLAEKIGIALALIRSWEDGTDQPDEQQMDTLAKLLKGKRFFSIKAT